MTIKIQKINQRKLMKNIDMRFISKPSLSLFNTNGIVDKKSQTLIYNEDRMLQNIYIKYGANLKPNDNRRRKRLKKQSYKIKLQMRTKLNKISKN